MSGLSPVVALDEARAVAAGLKRRWRNGEAPDAIGALEEHADLAAFKSIVVDLAYEEYLLRERAGEAPDARAFADRFPAFRASIWKMLDAHAQLVEHPELLDAPAAEWPEVETEVEGLQLLEVLGTGSFGRAYLAFDPATDRLCVLKLSTGAAGEARVMGRLAHPHVTDVYWARRLAGRSAVCMPFVGASTLGDIIAAAYPANAIATPGTARAILDAAEVDGLAEHADRRSAPVVRAAESYLVAAGAIAARMADAVAYLHAEGVVHGDLKPSNVVIGPGGAPHLIDFNLALDELPTIGVRGTPAYLAPEFLDRKDRAKPDGTRADLFALGVILYELFAGRHPFAPDGRASAGDLVAAIRRGAPALPASVPPSIARLVESCLAANPAERPASAAAVATALDRYVAARRSRTVHRPRLALAIACAAAMAGLAAIGSTSRSSTPPPSPASIPPREPQTADEFFQRGKQLLADGSNTASLPHFIAAHERSRDPWALAYVAYCFALDEQNRQAVSFGQKALEGGADSAAVRNNIAYALLQTSRYPAALAQCDEALRREPALQPALYNRGVARHRATVGRDSDPRAAEDIAAALAAGSPSADLHYDAAAIFATGSGRDPALRDRAIEQLRLAARAGIDPARFPTDFAFRGLLESPAFRLVCREIRGPMENPRRNPGLVEPRP